MMQSGSTLITEHVCHCTTRHTCTYVGVSIVTSMKILLKPVVKFINCLYAYCSENIIYLLGVLEPLEPPLDPPMVYNVHADPLRDILYSLFSYNKIHGEKHTCIPVIGY